MVTKFKFGGATPLIMACRNGHREIVEYLVRQCGADVEETGAVMFDHETVEGAPPLWCASAAGHLDIVRFLVEAGAQVNSKTRTNSTPLRAACFDGHFGVVKYLVEHGADFEVSNRHGHTCLMIACYKGHYKIVKYLLSLKADMNRKSSKGNTALHDCAEAGSIEILKLLLSHGARMDVDSYGMTPLLAAAVVGHQHIVEYLIGLNIVSRKEKIDSLELLGATYVDRKKDMVSAVELWQRAMDLRYKEGEPHISKPHSPHTIDAYEHPREVFDPDSLADIVADPDAIKNQALLIRERILGPAHPDTIYFLRYRGAMYADAGKFSRCISLWNYALDMQQAMLEPLNHMTLSTFYSFSELFEYMLSEKSNPATPTLPEQQRRRDLLLRGSDAKSLLHLSCHSSYTSPLAPHNIAYKSLRPPLIPNLDLTRILLRVGADPNDTDAQGNTALHLLAQNYTQSHLPVIQLLLNAGAHYDTLNAHRSSFITLLQVQLNSSLAHSTSDNNNNNNNNNNNTHICLLRPKQQIFWYDNMEMCFCTRTFNILKIWKPRSERKCRYALLILDRRYYKNRSA
uniref:Protein fem-1 homolog CG6966 n=1 Tax=Cacopsylla melanoneura TaxID=428564 RepID=A0A8D8XNC7_9HEMI